MNEEHDFQELRRDVRKLAAEIQILKRCVNDLEDKYVQPLAAIINERGDAKKRREKISTSVVTSSIWAFILGIGMLILMGIQSYVKSLR